MINVRFWFLEFWFVIFVCWATFDRNSRAWEKQLRRAGKIESTKHTVCWWLLINQIKSSQNQYLSSYLSSPWRPAALFDLPNHGGHQEQRQEAAVDGRRGTGESEKDIRVPFVAKKCTSMCISFSHTYIKQRALIFSFELVHIHVCFGPTAPARMGDYSPHWSALFLISNRSEASVSLPADTKVTSCCSLTISKNL